MSRLGDFAMLRKAALRIATLSLVDREWLLAQLSATERQQLEPMVAEALALGVDRDPSILQALAETPMLEHDTAQAIGPTAKDVIAKLPTAWRDIVVQGQPVAAEVSALTFLQQIDQSVQGPRELRRCLVEYVVAKHGAAHV